MTFTDKQRRYYGRIYMLARKLGTNHPSDLEALSLFKARRELTFNRNFGQTISVLISELAQIEVNQRAGLTPEVQNLYKDLKQDYGWRLSGE